MNANPNHFGWLLLPLLVYVWFATFEPIYDTLQEILLEEQRQTTLLEEQYMLMDWDEDAYGTYCDDNPEMCVEEF